MRYDAAYREELTLADGTPIGLRLLRPGDREALRQIFLSLSPASRYSRFFVETPELSDDALDYLTDVDDDYHLALIALTPSLDLKSERGVGVARYVRFADEPDAAEMAVTVIDELQGRGLGAVLLDRLVGAARERHLRRLRAELLVGNEAMARALRRVGAVQTEARDETLLFDLPLGPHAPPPVRTPLPLRWLTRAALTSLGLLLRWLRSPDAGRPARPPPAPPAPPRPALPAAFFAAFARDDGSAWLLAPGGGAFRSRDGGETWAPLLFDPSAPGGLRAGARARPLVALGQRPGAAPSAIVQLDAWASPRGLFAAAGALLRSDDGGTTWVRAPSPRAGDLWAGDAEGERAYALGAGGALYRSDDGGLSWAAAAKGPEGGAPFRALARWRGGVVAAGEGAAFSPDEGAGWRRLESSDGAWLAAWVDEGDALVLVGASFALVFERPDAAPHLVDLVGPGAGLVACGGGRLRTTDDGGRTFRDGDAPGPKGWALVAHAALAASPPPAEPAAAGALAAL
ncbi:MAG TPA: GNAT family N-acetyltransferase, partial [Polyangiaceae bacterium]|nr:GNAT family N-acetyltransferase [Polyangiaceae bacterium]